MRLLFVIDSLRPGGAERQLAELINGLANVGGYRMYLCCLMEVGEGYLPQVKPYLEEVVYMPRRFSFDISPVFQIARYIRQHRIEMVHAYLTLGALFGVFAARVSGRPVVCSGIRDAKDHAFALFLYKRIESALADVLISNSYAGLKNRFRRVRANHRVIYNGMDFNRFRGDSDALNEVKKTLDLHRYDRLVGMVASLSPFKDHETFLKAAKKVLKHYPDTGFMIIGEGPEHQFLENMTDDLDIRANMRFAGYRSDVDRIYPKLTVSVLVTHTNIHLEGISNTIIESMACGTPVIATRGGGTEEVIDDRKNGILISPSNSEQLAESIMGLFADEKRAKSIAENAKISVWEKFNLNRYTQDHIALYHEILSKSARDKGSIK